MKVLRIITLSLFCTLLFCSCQKNYPKLIIGKWDIDANASYFVENNKRKYCNEYPNENFTMQFLENGQVEISEGNEKKNALYHFDGDFFYVKGEAVHILKMNNKRMVIESDKNDPNDFAHFEFNRKDYNSFEKFFLNIKCSLPLWIRIILCIGFILLVIKIAFSLEDKPWWAHVLFWIMIAVVGYYGVVEIFFFDFFDFLIK